jgi:uncharacterized protein (TIGR02453 family)
MEQQFNGFSTEALQFLFETKINNNKAWYEANKKIYQEILLAPFQDLVSDLSSFMLTIDPNFITIPAVDKTISRIYRDTRFSKDKSLYRDSMWLTFKRRSEDWKEAPAYYFEITPDSYRYGMGIYNAPKPIMDKFRQQIDEKPAEFLKVISFYKQNQIFTLEVEKYKKILAPDKPAEIQEWYQCKSFHLTTKKPINELLFSKRLVPELISGFGLLAPLYNYLWEVKRLVDAEGKHR